MKILELSGVSFGYTGRAPILSGVNFSLHEGEKILVLGSNGSGKSTFALLVAGILRPQSGKVISGINRDNSLRTGIVFQNSRMQMVGNTVEEDLAFSLSILKYPSRKIRVLVNEYLELFELSSKRNSSAAQLSGGELRRLALASVLISEPDILILDEPLTMLDQHHQNIFLNYIKTMVSPKMSLIWLDHDLRSVKYFSKWYLLNDKTGLLPLTITDFNSKQFLKENHLEPAPLQYLEWKYPDKIERAIAGPEEIVINP